MSNGEEDETDWIPDELKVAANQINQGLTPPKITVRQLLQYFGFQRRGFVKAVIVQDALDILEIATDPPFVDVWIDAEIAFVKQKPNEPESRTDESQNDDIGVSGNAEVAAVGDAYDPTYRIGLLGAANQSIVSVQPDDDITTAVTRMLNNDFSQLPVMRTERDLRKR